ncbi:hypothetical protein [Bradyrhizobium brasilense]|uniref:hypothetical protein n=1 Tax=Bradyrhizobium brasilense TaxID=1419277 RepID=UPI001E5CBFCB|nr:hypothetical protein [Bradyrhizobium brasilense]MCC8972024.1 hypothetical protein [Bradyrhizobium brasilense]
MIRGWRCRLSVKQSPKLSWWHLLFVEYESIWIRRDRQIADWLIYTNRKRQRSRFIVLPALNLLAKLLLLAQKFGSLGYDRPLVEIIIQQLVKLLGDDIRA